MRQQALKGPVALADTCVDHVRPRRKVARVWLRRAPSTYDKFSALPDVPVSLAARNACLHDRRRDGRRAAQVQADASAASARCVDAARRDAEA